MLSMFDLSEHQLATISTWAEVAILAFMVWEKYGPHFLGGAGQLTAQQPAAGIWWALWANRTLMVAIAGMGIMVWLNLRVPLPNEFGEFTNPQLVQVTNETF